MLREDRSKVAGECHVVADEHAIADRHRKPH
jgi:hypothetical protein